MSPLDETGVEKMDVLVRELEERDLDAAVRIWNRVVEDGVAFPQLNRLTREQARQFFAGQSFTGVASDCAANTGN